jgi:non-specific serine/threonine protein kinase
MPSPPTRLIGRNTELQALGELLEHEWPRLITLTGPGGVGKTRLALAAAELAQQRFSEAVWFVDLAPIAEASLVVPTIIRALGIGQGHAVPPLDALAAHIGEREALLLLDNFEQVVAAAADIDAMLARCAGLRVLLTSREPLNLRREQIIQVHPLPVPEAQPSTWTVDSLQSIPSVEFFVDRAQAAGSAFHLSEANARAVAELIRRLDGLPLALELAAARTRCLEPVALLERVEQGLSFLRWMTPDLPPRHRTLRGTLDWSYALLNPEEQAVFRCLGVFAGRFTIDAVSVIARTTDLGVETLDALAALTDKHLVTPLDSVRSDPHFGLLMTIQEYTRELLGESDEYRDLRDRHLDYYIHLVEQADGARRGPDEANWLARLDSEIDNLRHALAWAIVRGNVRAEWRLVAGLALFWEFRGDQREGAERIEAALTRECDCDPELQARVLEGAGALAYWAGDSDRAVTRLRESLAAARRAGANTLAARVLGKHALVEYGRGSISRAQALAGDMLTLARSLDDDRMIGYAFLYRVLFAIGPFGSPRERKILKDALPEPMARLRAAGAQRALALLLAGHARLLAEDNGAAARAPLTEALRMAQEVNEPVVINFIPWIALVLVADHLPARQFACLAGGVHALATHYSSTAGRSTIDAFGSTKDHATISRALDAARATLGEAEFASASTEGRELGFRDLLQEFITLLADNEVTLEHRLQRAAPARRTESLISPREREVLVLLAEGRTNKAIADALFVAPSTIKTHVTSLLTKLDAENRAHLAAIATQQQFIAG